MAVYDVLMSPIELINAVALQWHLSIFWANLPIIVKMHPIGLWDLIKQVLSAWHVIAVTVAIVIYISIVSYVARSYHRPRMAKKVKIKKKTAPVAAAPEINEDEEHGNLSTNDELGLEEA